MKKKILSAVFGLALVASLSGQALAAESSMVRVGDTPIQMDVAPQIIDGTMFVAYPYVVRALTAADLEASTIPNRTYDGTAKKTVRGTGIPQGAQVTVTWKEGEEEKKEELTADAA